MTQGRLQLGPGKHVRKKTGSTSRWPLPLLAGGTLLVIAASLGGESFASGPVIYHHAAATTRHAAIKAGMPTVAESFISKNCLGCHTHVSGRPDLTTAFRPDQPDNFKLWVKVIDRVSKGEMPPKGAAQPAPTARRTFLAALSQPLIAVDQIRERKFGRSTWRRMNRLEYENTLRDLLGAPWLQIKDMLPEDGLRARFNKVGDALDVSYVQMSRYLAAASYAVHEAMPPAAARPETTVTRYYTHQERSFSFRGGQEPERGTYPMIGDKADLSAITFRRRRFGQGMGQGQRRRQGQKNGQGQANGQGRQPAQGQPNAQGAASGQAPGQQGQAKGQAPTNAQAQAQAAQAGFRRFQPIPMEPDPVKREAEAVGVLASSYEPLTPTFSRFRAPVSGRYRLRLRAHSFWAHPSSPTRWWRASFTDLSAGRTLEPVSLYASRSEGVTAQLRKLGTVDFGPESSVREVDAVLLKGESIMPDAARLFRSRPPDWHNPLATPEGQPGVAFHWLEVEGPIYDVWPTPSQRLLCGDLPLKQVGDHVEMVPRDPEKDGPRLVRAFMRRALRRPVAEADYEPFLRLYHTARKTGASFTESVLTAYTGVLCSPAFVTLEELPGPLDDYALASRLSYFLWNSEPDPTLRILASRKALHDPKVLLAQTHRMLADPRSQQFVDAFLDYWLDLRKTADTSPDEVLYPDYYLDDLLVESSVDETRAFFTELVKNNLPARNLVDSNFVMVNAHLANLYGIPGVKGCAIRRVPLPKDSVRGGLLTQASVLKVTANGTTTSPVLRGVWINERILGNTVPPPPPSLPAIEPDIRGATTIREQLAKHRSIGACNSCHSKIDPAGFALENFDVFGGWRDHYRALGDGQKVPGYGKNGQPFTFHEAQKVDASGVLPDGRHFNDVRELKRLLLTDERQIARNLVQQLVTYSTGATVRFGDRPRVEAILTQAQASDYGVKSIIHGIIASELFRNK